MLRKIGYKTKRTLAVLLCLTLILSMTGTVFAEETAEKQVPEVTEEAVVENVSEEALPEQVPEETAVPAAAEEEKETVSEEPEAPAEPAEAAPEEAAAEPVKEPAETEAAEPDAEEPAKVSDEDKAEPEKETKKTEKEAAVSDKKDTEAEADKKTEKKEKSEKTAKKAAGKSAAAETTKAQVRRANAAAVDNSTKLPDGEYTDFEYLQEGGTGKAKLTLTKLVVSGGKATGYFTSSSNTQSHVYYLGHTSGEDDDPVYYDPSTDTCGAGVVPITNREVSFPVCLNSKTEFACRSVAMTVPHWIQYWYTITIDESDKEQVSDLNVSCDVEGLSISAAELGVMEKSKKVTLRMTAGNKTFTKLFLGTAADAQKDGAEIIALSDEKVFVVSPFETGKEIPVSFYSKSDKIWHDAALIADAEALTLTITEGEKADYSKVEAAKKKVPSDLSIYMEERVKTLQAALDAVVEGLYASEQERVDAFAKAIEKAIAALEKDKLTIKLKAVDQDTKKTIKGASFKVTNEKGKTIKAEKDGVYSLENGTYTIKATAKNYEDAVIEKFSPTVEETITLELEPKEIIPEGTIIFRENEKDPSKTNLFNTTGMFKIVKGTLVTKKSKTTLTVSLSGSGYHYLFKGTYEEALANGLNKKNWIKGYVNDEGKWEFVIPLKEDETYIPIIAVSDSHLKKAEAGEEDLGSAIFARQIKLDLKKKTLTAGDYDEIADITVISKTEKFKAESKGTMEIAGGPNSNNYACKPTITMQDKLYNKAFIGTAANAAKSGAKTIKLTEGQFAFSFENGFNGSHKVITFEDKKPIAVAFFDTRKKEWTDYKLTIDKSAKTVTIEALKEDEAPPEEPEQPEEEYKDASNEGTSAVDSDTTLKDGVYTPKSFTFSGGTGRLEILCDKLEVRGGQAFATIRFAKSNGSAANVDSLRANGQTYSGFNTFTIPVQLNANNKLVARTTAMSQPHWIEYSIFIALDEPGKETSGEDLSENTTEMDEEAPSILGLKAEGETEIVYSDLVKIFNYEGGYYLIELDAVRDTARDTVEYRTQMEIAEKEKASEETEQPEEKTEEELIEDADPEEGSSAAESISDMIAKLYENEIIKYLIIPEGKEVPAGLDKEVIIISQPTDRSYVSSENALDLLTELGAMSAIQSVGIKAEDVKNTAVKEAMEKEKDAVIYGGAFDDWDLKSMILGHTNFALESSKILPKDKKTVEEDMENLVRLGQRSAQMEIAMFIDRSEDETNDLAKAEWYKVYGVIYGKTDAAQQLYQEAVNAASDQDKADAKALLEKRAKEKSEMKAEAKKAAQTAA